MLQPINRYVRQTCVHQIKQSSPSVQYKIAAAVPGVRGLLDRTGGEGGKLQSEYNQEGNAQHASD